MPFEKILPAKKKSLQAAELLLEEIRKGGLPTGSRLPPERELCEKLGVSRPVVREALSALQMLGIVESRVGDGTYVAGTASGRLGNLSSILDKLAASVSIVEALEAREALDISVAHLAIGNGKPEDLEELDRFVADMRQAIDRNDLHRYIQLTLDFHAGIAKVAGNTILEQAVQFLIDLIRPHLWVIEQNYDRQVAEQSFAVHAAILEGIRKRDLEAVIAAVRKHYREYPSLQR